MRTKIGDIMRNSFNRNIRNIVKKMLTMRKELITSKYMKIRRKKYKKNVKNYQPLTSSERKAYLKFWKESTGINVKLGLPYAELIKNTSGSFKVETFPHYLFHTNLINLLNDKSTIIANTDKNFLKVRIGKDAIENLIVYANGLFFDNLSKIISEEQANHIIADYEFIVLKKGLSVRGSGQDVKFVDTKIMNFNMEKGKEIYPHNFLIQKKLTQSSTMKSFNDTSINTIRITSLLLKTGNVSVLGAVVRFGKKGSMYDNAHQGGKFVSVSSAGITSSIARDQNGIGYTQKEIDNNFSAIQIPNWNLIIELINRNHPKFPYQRIVAWDIVLDENNIPFILEVNLNAPSLWLHDFDNGFTFGDETKEMLQLIKR